MRRNVNGQIDSNQTVHIDSLQGCCDLLDVTSELAHRFGRGEDVKIWPLTLTFALVSNTADCSTAHTQQIRANIENCWYSKSYLKYLIGVRVFET